MDSLQARIDLLENQAISSSAKPIEWLENDKAPEATSTSSKEVKPEATSTSSKEVEDDKAPEATSSENAISPFDSICAGG